MADLEEHQHLGGAIERELLDAGGDCAEPVDQGRASRSDRRERIGVGLRHSRSV
jgi:hypothetical protein